MTKRKRHTAKFKFQVALEASKNQRTRNQIASDLGVHPTQVSQWKRELLSNGNRIFETKTSRREKLLVAQETALYEQIGRLNMELEWLKKKAG